MFVPVVAVGGMKVSVVQVVHVVAVGDSHMSAIRAVLVFVLSMLNASINSAFVPMVFMLMVQVAVVDIVHVIVMGDSRMTAIRTMNVGMLLLHRQIMAYVLVHALVISHDLVGKASLTDEFSHFLHRPIDVTEKVLKAIT